MPFRNPLDGLLCMLEEFHVNLPLDSNIITLLHCATGYVTQTAPALIPTYVVEEVHFGCRTLYVLQKTICNQFSQFIWS